jgi:ubiquinone/menaquinone biosynthesis C-methylase UbiE
MQSTAQDNTQRFGHTVNAYSKYRPTYPHAVLELLLKQKIINSTSTIADIGAGTGIFTELLLESQAQVFAVEPNKEMCDAAIDSLSHHPNFDGICAPAEATTLRDMSVDLITVATAFHWFDREKCKKEFARILRRNGHVMLIWNLRLTTLSPVTKGFDDILKKYSNDYVGIPSQQIAENEFIDFFSDGYPEIVTFDNQQEFTYDEFEGRLHSVSFALTPEHPNYCAMINSLKELFDKEQSEGKIIFPYQTKAYLGKII